MKVYNATLKFSIICLTIVIFYFIFMYASFIPEYIVDDYQIEPYAGLDLSGLGDAILFVIAFVIAFVTIVFELVVILGFRRYYKDFKYLYKINLISFIIFLFFLVAPLLLFKGLLN